MNPDKKHESSRPGGVVRGAGLLVLLLLAVCGGYVLRGGTPAADHAAQDPASAQAQTWTCSMHPQVQQPKAGKCPLCGMDLIPRSDAGSATGQAIFTTSESAKALMRVETAAVERRFVTAEVRLVGKVDYDETRLSYITAWVPGRLDRLYVDYTGVDVRKGDHMVDLFSPDLLVAQDELRRAAQAVTRLDGGAPEFMQRTTKATLEAARNKLRLWGLTNTQIAQAEREGIGSDFVTIYAPIAGTVINRVGQEGMYVETGTQIYTIADLSKLWVKLDAYESDLSWIHYGQKVSFTTEAYPGDVFEGIIAFIDPVLNPATRTVKVRVNVPNPAGRLKPDMFVRAVISSQVATGGRVMDPGLAGKWICPMHPEIIKPQKNVCDLCKMDLVKAEDLGYVPAEVTDADKPLIIPVSAALRTGKRAVVYVEMPGADQPTYEGRQVVLGPRAGDYYIVKEGLREGERVVTNGNFKIDSALQIMAKPSMMMPEEVVEESAEGTQHFEAPEAFQTQLRTLYDAYSGMHTALAGDDFDSAKSAVSQTQTAFGAVDMALLEGDAHTAWMAQASGIGGALEQMAGSGDIDTLRTPLEALSDSLQSAIETFGIAAGAPVRVAYCPMALGGKGAHWLQPEEIVLNPYYGAMMLNCGEIVSTLAGE